MPGADKQRQTAKKQATCFNNKKNEEQMCWQQASSSRKTSRYPVIGITYSSAQLLCFWGWANPLAVSIIRIQKLSLDHLLIVALYR